MKFLSFCCGPSKQWLLVHERHLCLTERKIHPTCFSRQGKLIYPLQVLIVFAQLLRDPGPLGHEHLPQPPSTSSEVAAFTLLGFSSPPSHMGRATALQTFVVRRTTWVPGISFCPNPKGIWPFFPSWEPFVSLCVSSLFVQWR